MSWWLTPFLVYPKLVTSWKLDPCRTAIGRLKPQRKWLIHEYSKQPAEPSGVTSQVRLDITSLWRVDMSHFFGCGYHTTIATFSGPSNMAISNPWLSITHHCFNATGHASFPKKWRYLSWWILMIMVGFSITVPKLAGKSTNEIAFPQRLSRWWVPSSWIFCGAAPPRDLTK